MILAILSDTKRNTHEVVPTQQLGIKEPVINLNSGSKKEVRNKSVRFSYTLFESKKV